MALKQWCGKKCSECRGCKLDEMIPCSPDCENLTEDGKIKVKACLESGCEEVKYVLSAEDLNDKELLEKFGEIADYPYSALPDGVLTRTLNVTVLCQACYNSSIEVPADFSREQALDYAREHLEDIPLGVLEYVTDSDQLDEENCDFADQEGSVIQMSIRDLAYELYKGSWKIHHGIFRQQEVDALKDYYRYCQEVEQPYSFEDWLEEFGYGGELFACKEEFLTNEYLEESYVKELFKDDALFYQYQKDVVVVQNLQFCIYINYNLSLRLV